MACILSPAGEGAPDAGQPGGIIFLDDFSDPSSGWNRAVTPSGLSDYEDGVYRIFVRQPFIDIWSLPGINLEDARIEVDAFKVSGERNNRFGIICRVNGENYYTFMISSDGYYGIGKVRGLEHTLVGMQAMQFSTVINQGAASNHLRADCLGENLALYVNDQLVQQARDTDFPSGDVGLIAGTYDITDVEIFFDNFLVREP
jgi:hypothetical protein